MYSFMFALVGMEEETCNNSSSTERNDITIGQVCENEDESLHMVMVGENIEEKVEEPTTDMILSSLDELIGYYRNYCNKMVFAVYKRTSTHY